MKTWAIRLAPGADLKGELSRAVAAHGFRAACILTCVGSLSRARLRMAGASGEPERFTVLDEPTEIVSLVGTLCLDGLHLHIGLARRDGLCVGGHLADGCIVHTTAEIVLRGLPDVAFARTLDAETGYRELTVSRRLD